MAWISGLSRSRVLWVVGERSGAVAGGVVLVQDELTDPGPGTDHDSGRPTTSAADGLFAFVAAFGDRLAHCTGTGAGHDPPCPLALVPGA